MLPRPTGGAWPRFFRGYSHMKHQPAFFTLCILTHPEILPPFGRLDDIAQREIINHKSKHPFASQHQVVGIAL